ncbi:MAG: 30S ribosomal protein S9 [uncultured bacterium]|nr:MAG: 30S ribosomal protein S9 [uncultured bacterium]
MATISKKNYTFAVGRRKSASARVRLFKGTGENLINGKKIIDFLLQLEKPFKLTETIGKYYFSAVVAGGGKEGQIEAIVHGISRALVKLNSEKFRVILKKNNLLTRDPRVRLRRMVGTGGKARRKKQSPKR